MARSLRFESGCSALACAGLALLWPFAAIAQDVVPDSRIPVRVTLPNDHNLQWMNFWVALGAGYFADQGLAVDIVLPGAGGAGGGRGGGDGGGGGGGGGDGEGDDGSRAVATLLGGSADFAVLPRPAFLIAVEQASPVLAVANLLSNDPVNLVVQGEIAAARGLSIEAPLADRLNGIRGLRVGVAGGPVTRLRVLLAAAGMDADRDIETVIVPGGSQNAWFADGRVDAIYAHTPYLETALTEQGGVMIVNQSAGEVAELAGRQIHLLVTTRELAAARPELVLAMTRAVYRAQRLIHRDREATLAAIRSSAVRLQAPAAVERIVAIYAVAIPQTPAVSAEGALRELALFPGRRVLPNLNGVAIEDFVDNSFASRAIDGQ